MVWHAACVLRMQVVKDVNGMDSWNYLGVRMQNGVRFADAGLIRI